MLLIFKEGVQILSSLLLPLQERGELISVRSYSNTQPRLANGESHCVMKIKRSLQLDMPLSSIFPFHNAEVLRPSTLTQHYGRQIIVVQHSELRKNHYPYFLFTVAGMCIFYQPGEKKQGLAQPDFVKSYLSLIYLQPRNSSHGSFQTNRVLRVGLQKSVKRS